MISDLARSLTSCACGFKPQAILITLMEDTPQPRLEASVRLRCPGCRRGTSAYLNFEEAQREWEEHFVYGTVS